MKISGASNFQPSPCGNSTSIVVVGMVPSIQKLVDHFHNVIQMPSLEDLKTKIRKGSPRAVIVPSNPLGAGTLKFIKERWPATQLIMLFGSSTNDERRRETINSMAEAHRCGAALIKFGKAIRQVSKLLGLIEPCRLRVGSTVHGYKLLKYIASGNFGDVFLVSDAIGCYFALKVIYQDPLKNPRFYEREYEAIRLYQPISLEYKSLLKILHVGKGPRNGYFFYSMELADDRLSGRQIEPGRYRPDTLESRIRRGLSSIEALQFTASILVALDQLHKRNLINADLKPENILFIKGALTLADPSLITFIGENHGGGTHGYSPAEGPGGPTADLYAVGKIVYVMITRRSALACPSFPVSVSGWKPDALAEVKRVICKACAPTAAARYQSAKEMGGDILKLLSQIEE